MDLSRVQDKFNTLVVVTNNLNSKLSNLRKKTINLSITSHNLSGNKVDERTQSELAALTVIAKEFKDDVDSLENMVHTINEMSDDIKFLLKEKA